MQAFAAAGLHADGAGVEAGRAAAGDHVDPGDEHGYTGGYSPAYRGSYTGPSTVVYNPTFIVLPPQPVAPIYCRPAAYARWMAAPTPKIMALAAMSAVAHKYA